MHKSSAKQFFAVGVAHRSHYFKSTKEIMKPSFNYQSYRNKTWIHQEEEDGEEEKGERGGSEVV